MSRRTLASRGALRQPAMAAGLRAFAVFALFLLAGQHVLPGLHHALLTHRVCAAHGELIHGDHGTSPAAAHERTSVSEGAGEEDHDHCGVTPTLENRPAPELSARSEVFPACTDAPAPVAGPQAFVAARALFRVAPKQSPPRA